MESLVFTQLSIPEIRQLLRQELQAFFDNNPLPASETKDDQLFTIQQAAAFLSLSVPTIYGLVSKHQLPVSKRGKRLYFSKKDITAWVKEGRKKTTSEIDLLANQYIKDKKL